MSRLKNRGQRQSGCNQSSRTPSDTRPPFTPARLAGLLAWHEESVRRKLRNRDWSSIVISRRRLIPASEVDRILTEGFIARV